MSMNVALRCTPFHEPEIAAASYLAARRLFGESVTAYERPSLAGTIQSHARFSASRRVYVNKMLALYEHDRFMNRLLMEAGRSLVFFVILALHASYDEAERETWTTLSLVQKTVQPHGVASARRIGDIVARFVETGFLRSEAAKTDRRVKILTPTAKMLAHDCEWLAAHFAALDTMFPEPGYEAPMRRDARYQQAHRAISRTMIPATQRLMAGNPAIMLFMEREAGMMILMKLMQIADDRDARMSFADIGGRFGVSRTHVRAVLQDAAEQGLLEMTPLAMSIQPALVSAFDRYVAATMAHQETIYRMVTDGAQEPAGRAA